MISKFDVTIQSDELTAADLYNAQAEWEAQQYEAELSDFDPHRDFYAEMDDEPEMILEDDLYMIIEDDPYDGEMWEDAYDDHPADMYVWDCDLHNEF
jgi:hypothetical protein